MEHSTPPSLSLLDVIDAYWRAPLVQRLFRGGLGLGLLALGAWQRFVDGNTIGYLTLLLGVFLLTLSALVAGGNDLPRLEIEPMPADVGEATDARPVLAAARVGGDETVASTRSSIARPSTASTQASPAVGSMLSALRLPAALTIAFGAQVLLASSPDNPWPGIIGYGVAIALLIVIAIRERLLPRREEVELEAQPLRVRWPLFAVALALTAGAFLFLGGNRFNAPGVIAWMGAIVTWIGAFWQGSARESLGGVWGHMSAAWARGVTLRIDRIVVILVLLLGVGAYFRFAEIDQIPIEMTSDHVEKLLDVADLVLGGQNKIFFERNTGREPLQFYWTALVNALLGTGISHLSLKIGTALFGFLMLPSVYLLGRELEGRSYGLLALAIAAISFWATAISRVGLRFPLSPLFVAPVLYLVFRGLRTGRRNDFLLAGLVLGISLYGYSPIRVLPAAMAVVVGLFLLWPAARGRRAETIVHLMLAFVTAAIVFTPLLRYMSDNPEMFWYRAATRLTDSENPIIGQPLWIFLQNNWNALLMFNYRGDMVWVNTLRGRPVMDLFSGALLVLGAAYVLVRAITRRDWRSAALVILVPVLLLPSTLSLAYPDENPSVVRAGGAIPVVAALAAYPLWLLLKRVSWASLGQVGNWAAAGTLGVVLVSATLINRQMYFVEYPQQYILGAQNASEIGEVIHDFANTFGSYDTAYVRPYPYWVDTRAVGMYAGDPTHDYAIQFDAIAATAEDPQPKLFILHRDDTADAPSPRSDGVPQTLPELERLFPNGVLSVYKSSRPDHDFLVYYVPGR